MVYQVRLIAGGRERVAWSTSKTRSIVAAVLIYFVTLFTFVWTVLAAMHYTDPNLTKDAYCQQNKFSKELLGQEDIIDNTTSVCNSSIVLSYTVEQLKTPLWAAYLAQAVTGALLTAAAPPALVGALVGQRRLLLVWALADLIWCSALIGSAAALAPFGFPTLVPMLAGSAAACLLVGCLVLACGLWKPDRLKHSHELELSQRDPERGESDLERGESDLERGESDLERGESDLERGESDLERGESDLERGESDLERGESHLERGETDLERGESDLERGEKKAETRDYKWTEV